ncbi:MGMT family protein [Chitinolyticbacter albus]|uniref:MGMT family protein n=1 Tax=Chitinolyticbacter albus TaxID=2961951 RepID=UPI00210C1F8E|nr:MGMT family protein [Chitinolyticbacter albus]
MKKPTDSATIREAIRAVVAQIPYGQVMSYGDVARAAGYPRHARMVGRVLDASLPWYRVINAQGKVSVRGMDGQDELQRMLLEQEGVVLESASTAPWHRP